MVMLPPIEGSVDQNNFGEFGTRLFMFKHTKRSGPIDPRVKRMGRRSLRIGENAGRRRVRVGHRVGHAQRRGRVHVGDGWRDEGEIQRDAARDRRAPPLRDGEANGRRRRS